MTRLRFDIGPGLMVAAVTTTVINGGAVAPGFQCDMLPAAVAIITVLSVAWYFVGRRQQAQKLGEPYPLREFMSWLSKRMAFATLGGLALTALSLLVYAGGTIETDVWGFPWGYFMMEYLPGSNTPHIFPLQTLFDFLFWFDLCIAAVVVISFAWNLAKPLTRDATRGLNHP